MLSFLARGCSITLLFFAWVATAFAAPTAPSGLNAVSLTATSFTLRWSGATGGSGGIAGYDIYRDGSFLGSTIATVRTIAVNGITPATVYSMTVVARDGTGSLSPTSGALLVTTPADTTLPTRPMELAATAITTSSCSLIWNASTDNVGVTGYNIYRSGVLLGSATGTSFDVTGLAPDSNHSITVRATDAAGNLSAASVALTVRTMALPPSAPTGLAATALKATSFTLTWAAATGGTGGIAGYDVSRDGTLIGSTTTARTFAMTGLSPTATYQMTVISRDTAGNVSPASVALEVTTPVDTTVPTRPADLASANVTTTSFTLTWMGSTDNVGVTGYNIYRSGVQLGTTSGTSYQVTGLIPDSTNNITVRALDAAGNLSAASFALSVRMVALPPSTPTGLIVAALRPSSFTLQWSASTGGTGGIKGYEVFLNGVPVGSPTTRSLAVSGLVPQTAYTLTVTSHDSVGNVSVPSEPLVISTPADTTKPTVPKGLSADLVTPAGFTLMWTASTDNVGVIGYDVYRNNLLIGSTPTPVFVVTGHAPLTLSSMRVKAKDAAGNISGFSAILPVTTSALPNVPPTIALNSPADGSNFTLPFTLILSATATDSDGTITKVEFFDNGTLLGETTAPDQSGFWLLTLSSQLSTGLHSLTARATDNRNATADSDAVAITVKNPNSSPIVTITAPTNETGLVAPGFVTIAADATDSDGTITKVDFYEGDNLLGTVVVPTTPPTTFTFPLTLFSTGVYTLTAVATDSSSAQSASAPVVVNVGSGAAALPYVANFEPTEGYRPGPLAGQLSWVATAGVTVAPSATPGSQQELAISAAQPAEIVSRDFSAPGISPVYVDFHARPVAGASPASAMIFSTPAAQVALVGTNFSADLWIFGGAGLGWHTSGQTFATDGNGRTMEWIRLTNREDYLQKKWDLYLNGQMISADVPFADPTAGALTDFSVNGHATVTSAFDDFYAGAVNPLFADENHNGLDDTWETAHGLSLATDNRQLSPAGNGITVLQAYLGGSNPNDFYNGTTPTLTIISGNNQTASPGQFNAQPLVVLVTNSAGTPLGNAPVSFTVTTGGGLLSSATTGAPLATTLSLRTAINGTAQAYFQQPATMGVASRINASTATAQVTFQTGSENAADIALFNFNFESQEGFSIGSIGGQNGWQIKWGTGEIVADAAAPSGAQITSISGTSAISCNLPTPLSGQCTVDFYARLVAGDSGYSATNLIVGEAGVALVLNSAGNEAEVYTSRYNDYAGVYGVAATGAMVPVDAEGRSGWLHFRFKLNFDQSHWDLYLDNTLIAASRPLSISQARTIQMINGTSAVAYFDLLSGSAVSPSPDSDENGLPDAWEIQNFGYVGIDPDADPDGDGLSNLQEFQNGTDPNDYYNGTTPQLLIVSGDNQTAPAGQFDPLPLKVSLLSPDGARPLINATVTFAVAANAGLVSETKSTNALKTSISLHTDDQGIIQVYYLQPATLGTSSQVNVTAGGAKVSFTTSSSAEPIDPNNPTDTDGNNLPDGWEMDHLGLLKYGPNDDPFGAGRTLRESYQLGLDPHNTAISANIVKPPANDPRPGPYIAIPLVLPSTTRSQYSNGIGWYGGEIDHVMGWGLCLNDQGQVFGKGVPDSYIWENGEWTLAYPANASVGIPSFGADAALHSYYLRTYKTALNNSGEIIGFDGTTGYFGLYLKGQLERLLWHRAVVTPEGNEVAYPLTVVSVNPLGQVSGKNSYSNSTNHSIEVRWWEGDPTHVTNYWGKISNDLGDSVCMEYGNGLSFVSRTGEISRSPIYGLPKSFNDNGKCLLVGSERINGDVWTQSSYIWNGPTGQVTSIQGSLYGQTWFDPTAISNNDDIVGRWWDSTLYAAPGGFWGGIPHPIVQRNGVNFDLYELISNKSALASMVSDPQLFGFSPLAINKRGQILIADYRETAYLLTPTADIARLAVDANRDGTIIPQNFENMTRTPDLVDETTAERPYRFWINDDDDNGDTEGSDIPNPSSTDAADTGLSNDGSVDGIRDLVDFFPVFLDLKQLLTVLPPSASVKYKLKQADSAVNFIYTKLSRSDALKYQTEDEGAIFGFNLDRMAGQAETRRVTDLGVELSEQFLTGIKDQDWGVILIEGRFATTKPLVLAVEKDGTTIAEVKLHLSISSIESMYRWINLRNVAGQSITRATNTGQPVNYPDSLTNGKMFVLLHGYNVNEDQSRGWGSESFKRLYWSGSHAMFTLVSWHGDHSQIPYIGVAPDYWQNINYAFMTAQALPAAIDSLPGSSRVIAGHSMGNVVVSSAIADHGLSVSHYFMLNAAVALEAYDTAAMSIEAMRNPGWATCETRLWPTEWFNLFPSGDGRRGLTWRDRFGNIANATNFYSSGEDVLNNNDFTPGQVPSVGGERAWVLQEMVKGTNHIGAVLTFDVQGGWGFNSSWDIPTFVPDDSDAGGFYVYNRRTSAQAAALTENQLRTQPFFRPFQDTRFVSATAGSAAAAEYLPRADALGGAIPALSFATGRNPIPLFDQQDRNIDLMDLKDGWPRTGGRWFHSDAKNIAYRYNHLLWEKWIELGELK